MTRHARWLRDNFFATPASALLSVAVIALLLATLPGLLHWAGPAAVWQADAAACRAQLGEGACWGVIAEKWRVILLGRYPLDEQWRPALACGLLLAALAASASGRLRGLPLAGVLLTVLAAFIALMGGGFAGLSPVGTERWGGLPLTLLLTLGGMAGALPLGLAVALGRLSPLAVLRVPCLIYVELVRGVPLVSVLFLAAFLLPMLLPAGFTLDALLRVQLAIILFAAAYLSETLRGGLQAIPAAQHETAAALGLSPAQALRWVLLPQALRAVLPSLVNSAIALFKDTSLITVVSLFELTGSLGLALAGDAQWRAFHLEGYLFIGAIYWLGCFALSRWSAGLNAPRGR